MEVFDRHNLYLEYILGSVPRMLTELDRDPFSFTYGSFDREYWAWATKDFSNIDLQRAIYPLTLLYCYDFNGNRCFNQPRILDWIKAAFAFWSRVQHKNGSYDHHYPNEFSFVGVAFPLYETTEAFRLLVERNLLSPQEQQDWEKTFCKGADFLCARDELHGFISNHRMGAANALEAVHQLFGGSKYKERSIWLRNGVLERASSAEGWPSEYNGMDPGYQTLTTYYMANYYRLTGDEEYLDRLIVPSLKLLQYFVHPDGSVGGEYGSRNCSLYYPSGVELLAGVLPEAEAIAQKMADGIRTGNSPTLLSQDIRNFVPQLSSYAQALLVTTNKLTPQKSVPLPNTRHFERYWPEAGVYVRSSENQYAILSIKKGGVLKIFDNKKGNLCASHGGYYAKTSRGGHFSTQILNNIVLPDLQDCFGKEAPLQKERRINLDVELFEVMHDRTMSPLKLLLFRIFTITIGRSVAIGDWVKRNIITGRYVTRKQSKSVGRVRRLFVFRDNNVTLSDHFSGISQDDLAELRAGDIFTTIYMASSKYFRNQEMIVDTMSKKNLRSDVDSASIDFNFDNH